MNVTDRLKLFPPQKDFLLVILHDLQNQHPQQYLPREHLEQVAMYLNMTMSAVYGVVSYYSMFSLTPRGKHLIRICKSPVCCIEGALPLIDYLKQKLGIGVGETTSDGQFTLETSECLGKCEISPGLLINEKYYGNLTASRLDSILNRLREISSD